MNTQNFTASNQLFLDYPQINYWRFEVVYQFVNQRSVSALHFTINSPPENGSCQIQPQHGTINTLFNISCPNWQDDHDIKDYSLYGWKDSSFCIENVHSIQF